MNNKNLMEYIELIKAWAIEREIDKKGTPKGQALKTYEEFTELEIGILKNDLELIKDSIGDVFVTLVIGNMITNELDLNEIISNLRVYNQEKNIENFIKDIATYKKIILTYPYQSEELNDGMFLLLLIAEPYDLTLLECVEQAYNEISKRTGKMVNGVFVKDSDLLDYLG